MKNVKFVNGYNGAGYAEEGQAHPFRMILCKKDGDTVTALHNWIKCRDFVAEALFSELANTPKSIYSFGWSAHYKDKPITTSPYLYVAVKGEPETLKKNLKLLNVFEVLADMEQTVILDTDQPDVLVLEADIGWRKSPTLLNLYSLLVKVLQFGELPTADTLEAHINNLMATDNSLYNRERKYWAEITKPYGWAGVERLVKGRDTYFDLDWVSYSGVSTSTLHHGHGPVAFFTACQWVKEGEKSPNCCEVIKSSVVKFSEAA